MKLFKKLATHTAVLAAFALTLTGCPAEQEPANDPLAGITLPSCPPVQNPLTDYWWMKREVNSLVKYPDFKSKIYKGQYKNTNVYLIETYYPNNPNLWRGWVLDCTGQGLISYCRESKGASTNATNVNALNYTPCKEDKYMPLKKQVTNLTLLFEEK